MIKMLTAIAGDDFSVSTGEVTDRFAPEEEKRLIDKGLAEKVAPKKKATKKAK